MEIEVPIQEIAFEFEMTRLLIAPFNLEKGDDVVVIARAVNLVGPGEYSDENTQGAKV